MDNSRSSLSPLTLLAVVFLVLSCLMLACVGIIFINPTLVPESFRSVAVVPQISTRVPTRTPSPTSAVPTFPPTWTPSSTPTITDTPLPSDTPAPTDTGTPRPPTRTPTETLTPTPTATNTPTPSPTGPTPTRTATRSAFKYTTQPGYPQYLPNFANTAGCNWMGFAGQVFSLEGNPEISFIVHLEGGGLNLDSLTGSGPAAYGSGSYEIAVNNKPVATTGTYRLQLRAADGAPLSDNYVINTFDTCDKNLIKVNFVQNHR